MGRLRAEQWPSISYGDAGLRYKGGMTVVGGGQPADYRDDELDLIDDYDPELDLLDDLCDLDED